MFSSGLNFQSLGFVSVCQCSLIGFLSSCRCLFWMPVYNCAIEASSLCALEHLRCRCQGLEWIRYWQSQRFRQRLELEHDYLCDVRK